MAASKKNPIQREISGTVVARTASGLIYRSRVAFSAIHLSSVLATLQELAARAEDPKRKVISSLAQRVHGDDAFWAWYKLSTQIVASQLARTSVRTRLQFLYAVLARARRSGGAPGLEAVACSALNAAWPYLELERRNAVARTVSKLAKSPFAEKYPVAVLDPVSRSVSLLKPGQLASIDIEEWIVRQYCLPSGPSGFSSADDMAGVLGGVVGKSRPDLSGLLGQTSDSDYFNALAAGLLGYRPGMKHAPDISQIPGFNGGQRDPLDGEADQLLGRGPLGKAGGLFGQMPGSAGKSDGWQGALSDFLGTSPGKFGPGGFDGATPGSPYAPTGYLGPQGTMGSYGDFLVYAGKGMQIVGAALLGGAASALASGAAAPAAPGMAIDGVVLIGVGLLVESKGQQANSEEDKKKQDGPPTVEQSGGQTITTKPVVVTTDKNGNDVITAPTTVIGPNDPPPTPPPKDVPHDGDLYPDPDGEGGHPTTIWDEGGGGGTPNTIWDENGGGGRPNSMWDENGGGGRPNSMWDENFGGTGPKTRPVATLVAESLVGPGLLAQFVQVGDRTLIY